MKKETGITLIVLLILAAVTINLTLEERGIFNTAKKAGQNYKEASEKELADLTNLEREMQNAINGTGNVGNRIYRDGFCCLRPVVRLKSDVMTKKGTNGVWQLQ